MTLARGQIEADNELMRLVTKTFLRMSTVLAIVALLAVLAVSGLLRLTDYFTAAQDQYDELRLLYEVGHHAELARLAGEGASRIEATRRARVAAARLHETVEGKPSKEVAIELETLLDDALAADDAATPATTALLGRIAVRSTTLRNEIIVNRENARDQLRWTIWGMAIVGGLALVLCIVLGLLEYLGVARPLRNLAHGIDALKHTRHPPPLKPLGDTEFRSLTLHFNETAEALNLAYDDLEAKVERRSNELIRAARLAGLGSLAAGFAHEINNPLGIISGYCELALRQLEQREAEGEEVAALRERLTVMLEETHRCKSISMRMLHLVDPSIDQRRVVSLLPLIEGAFNTLKPLPQFAHVTMAFVVDAEPLHADVNEQEIVQVVINLLNNAANAAPREGGRIVLRAAREADMAQIDVRDNGPGVDDAIRDRIFEPFFSQKTNATARQGHGLGLWVCQEIARRHNGRLEVISPDVEGGATFRLVLPIATPMATGTAGDTTPVNASVSEANHA